MTGSPSLQGMVYEFYSDFLLLYNDFFLKKCYMRFFTSQLVGKACQLGRPKITCMYMHVCVCVCVCVCMPPQCLSTGYTGDTWIKDALATVRLVCVNS